MWENSFVFSPSNQISIAKIYRGQLITTFYILIYLLHIVLSLPSSACELAWKGVVPGAISADGENGVKMQPIVGSFGYNLTEG